jgi:choline dehydrogenase-like flavoprotein
MTAEALAADYVIVGGGTAGPVLAARLSEDPDVSVCLIEWGPSDQNQPRALELLRWAEMLESEFDFAYRSVPQPRGNSHIVQSRARILGGCSSHNTMIAFRPPVADLREWEALGASGWGEEFAVYYDLLLTNIVPVAPEHRNPFLEDVITAASSALQIPVREDWNRTQWSEGTGFLELGYRPGTGVRSSASVDYLHPIMGSRQNLTTILETRVTKVLFGDGGTTARRRATGVRVRRPDGSVTDIAARREVVLCAGAIDTPRLLLLSGVGPAEGLAAAGVPLVHELPGVGENLMDHPEGLLLWESTRPISELAASQWDAIIAVRVDADSPSADVLCHIPLLTLAANSERLGFETPPNAITLTPNVAKPRSRGRVWIESADPERPPLIDYCYFTDQEGYDERIFLAGMRMGRRVAQAQPMADWIAREIFPGPEVQSDNELSELARQANHTVYHVSGTCRIGAADDPRAVVDPQLRVRGIDGLRVADASVFPKLTTVNPVATVLMVGERAADLISGRPRTS